MKKMVKKEQQSINGGQVIAKYRTTIFTHPLYGRKYLDMYRNVTPNMVFVYGYIH